MLTLFSREKKNWIAESGHVVLNTQFMSEIEVYETTKSKFKYLGLPENRRGGYDTYIVSEPTSTIKTKMDTAWNSVYIELDVYPDDDLTKATEAIVFNADEIVKCQSNAGSKTSSWLWVNQKGFGIKRYLIAHYYVNLAALAQTGTTTTTTSTSTTSTTSTTTTTTS